MLRRHRVIFLLATVLSDVSFSADTDICAGQGLSLILEDDGGMRHHMEFNPAWTIAQLKEKVAEGLSLPSQKIRLEFENEILADSLPISSTKIVDSSLLTVWHEEMQIFIKTLHAKTLTFNVSRKMTFDKLFQLMTKAGLGEPDSFRLIFACYALERTRTFESYNIQKESTLHLVTRLQGD